MPFRFRRRGCNLDVRRILAADLSEEAQSRLDLVDLDHEKGALFHCFRPLYFATSFVALEPALPDSNTLPISTLPTHQNNATIGVLECSHDGSMSLLYSDSNRFFHWTYESGNPIHKSYQAPHRIGPFIDIGPDWKLYFHDKSKGIHERLRETGKDLLKDTPIVWNGARIMGGMQTTVTTHDAETGTLVQTFSPLQFGLDGENPMLESSNNLLGPGNSSEEGEGVALVYITRIDYGFAAYSEEDGSVLWRFMYSNITSKISLGPDISCLKNFLSPQQSAGIEDKAKTSIPMSCERTVQDLIVNCEFRYGGFGRLDHPALLGSVDHTSYSLPGYKELVLYSAANKQLSIPDQVQPIAHRSGFMEQMAALISVESIAMTALALPNDDLKVASNNADIYVRQPTWASFIFSSLFGALIMALAIYYYFMVIRSNKLDKDLKLKPSVTKRRKTRKSGAGKNNQVDKLKESEYNIENEGSSGTLAYPHMRLSALIGGEMEGRQIGKLYISYKEIARGSNGTVVLEGIYDSRPVAVKRLVQTHHDMALKEIENLIASDQHPNIVRWYGMEFDADFVYLSLERCTCNLNDWISFFSRSPKGAISQDSDSYLLNDYFVQLQQRVGNISDFELWRVNGYPSPQLLKLMRDVVSGLAHLHEIGIIHRDLKPQNVLIVKEKTICAKLSDMGISKRLDGDMTSFSQHATGIGSSGWRAPEQLKNGRQSRALDLFSLGCVLFFCMTGGRHPFGDTYERDSNIMNSQKDLFLVDSIPEALDLITNLLDPNPDLRPKAVEVLHHPLFWSSDTRLSFLRDASDRVELEDRECESKLLVALESVASNALGGKWDEKLDNSFLGNIGRYRRYKYHSVRDLLRVVRNKLNHYRELPLDIQEALGSVPEGFDYYFTSRFPKLLIEVYKVIRRYCEGEELLSKYFKSTLI